MRSPIRWFGGKGNFTQHLLPLIPDHTCYVEVFGGGASLLFAKPPSKVEVYNDIDGDVVAFFRLFHDDKAMEEFKRKCFYTPYSRDWHDECKNTWRECEGVERIYRWFMALHQSFRSDINNDTWQTSPLRSKPKELVNTVAHLDKTIDRLRLVHIDNASWEKVIDTYDRPTTFFYLDPPYLEETRSYRGFTHEMPTEAHHRLIDRLLDIQGKVLLSGYRSNLYDTLGWERSEIETTCHYTLKEAGQHRRTECLWRNYEIQPTLFEV